MDVQIIFTGLAREIVGSKQIQVTLEEGATYSDIVEKISSEYPGLVNIIIEPNGRCLLNANFFSRGEEDVIFPSQMDDVVRPGEKLLLISIIVGG
jgi:molybdopterin converting factor small subunit